MANQEIIEVTDLGLIDQVIRQRSWTAEQDDRQTVTRTQRQEHPIPEEYMTRLETHIGDAGAKVTVGAELSHNRDYCKAQSFVSVTVTCNNKEEDIQSVHNIALEMVEKLVHEDLTRMKAARDVHLGIDDGKVASPPRASVKPPAVQPAAAAKPGVQRPSFRR